MKTTFRGRVAYIVDSFDSGNGNRYVLDSAGWRWSVTARELSASEAKKAESFQGGREAEIAVAESFSLNHTNTRGKR